MINKQQKRGARRGTGKRSAQRRNAEPKPVVPRIALGSRMCYGFPPVLLTKLRYCESYTLSVTSGSIGKQVNSLNSIFDPDQTGSGHQPMYRDTYAAIYDQYAVVSSRITVTYVNLFTATGVHIGLVKDDNTTTSSTYSTLMEQNMGKHTLLSTRDGALSSKTMSLTFDCKKDLGIDPYASETYKTDLGSNPTETYDCLSWATPVDGTSTGSVQIAVEIEYLVLFTELSTPTAS